MRALCVVYAGRGHQEALHLTEGGDHLPEGSAGGQREGVGAANCPHQGAGGGGGSVRDQTGSGCVTVEHTLLPVCVCDALECV